MNGDRRGVPGRVLTALSLLILCTAAAAADEKKLLVAVDGQSSNCKAVSQKIYELKELGQQEVQSSQLLMEELRKLGFTVTGDLKVPADLVKDGIAKTAFRAELAGKGPGPTVTIMLEYDALPNGHSCGHNLISGAGLLAAAGLSAVMKETPGRLLVIGTPDEERGSLGGGKIALLEGGHFEGTDLVLAVHAWDHWNMADDLLAMKRATFVFKGKAAHAAAAPHQGVNALDAAIQTFNSVNALRQHLRQDVRIHGIIKKGGEAVNVVPALAEAEFAARALDTATMEAVHAKVVNCARAAASAEGATLEYTPPRTTLLSPIMVPDYLSLVFKNIKSVGVKDDELYKGEPMGSSDLGNVGHAYPTVNIVFKVAPKGISLHSDEMLKYTAPESGWTSTVQVAKVVALTTYQLLTDPAKVKAIQERFKTLKAAEAK